MTKKRFYVLFAFLFAVVFALVCAFTLTACGNKDEENKTTPDDTTTVVPGGDDNPGDGDGNEDIDTYTVKITTEKTAYVEGDTETLTATVYLGVAATSEKVTWSVKAEPEGCVTIDENGLLTAVSEGKATITAMFAYGEGETVTASLDITVSAEENPNVPGKSDEYAVTIETDTATLTVGGETVLSAYISVNGEKDESLSVEWSANPSGLVEITGSTLKAVGAGTVTVTASYKYGETEDDVASASISIVISEPVSTHTHIYSDPAWTWTGDDTNGYTVATATFTCTAEGDDCTWTNNTYAISYTLTSADVTSEAATCVAAGKTTYTAVVTLDKEYKDTKEVTIPATGEHTYTVENAQWTWTETTDGYSCTTTAKCSVCEQDVTVEAEVTSQTHAATCTEAGYTEYTATYENNPVDTKKVDGDAAMGHTYTVDSNTTWTWTETDDGYACTATVKCTVCQEDVTVEAEVTSQDTAPTCTAAGYTTYTATYNGGTVNTKTVTGADATGHTCTVDETTTWTWTETDDGYTCTATVTCSVCSEEVTLNAEVTSETHDATCTESGHTDYTATYGGETVGETKTVEGTTATGHTYTVDGNTSWTWNETDDGYACTASVTCSVCNEEITLTAEVTSETVAATCGEAGYTTYTATYDGQTVDTKKVEGDAATGEHQYSTEGATWTWTEEGDGYACTATVTCTVCGQDVTLKAEVTSETHEATCTEAGHTDYTATYEGNTVGETKTVEGATATGVHTYTATSVITWDWTWRNDDTEGLMLVATATVKCDVCGGSTYLAEGTVTGLDADEKYTATLTIPAASNATGADATYTDTCYENYAINITGTSGILAGEHYTLSATVTLDGSTYVALEAIDEEITITWEITDGGDYAVIEADTGILTAEAMGDIKVTATFVTKDNRTITSEVEISIGKNPTPKIANLDFDDPDTYSFITRINSGDTESGTIAANRTLTEGILTLQTRASGTMTVGHNTSTDRYGLKTGTNGATTSDGGYIKIDLSDYRGQTLTITAEMSSYSSTEASLILATDIATSTNASSVLKYVTSSNSASVTTLSSDSIEITEGTAALYITWTGYIYLYSVVVRVADSAETDTYTVKIDSTEETITVGDEVSLGATVYMNGIPYKNLTVVWSCETVDGGAVELDENTGYLKGVTEGTVIITATYTPAGGAAVYDTMTIEVVASATQEVSVVHLDFSEPETYESWIGAAPTTASDSSSGWTELSSVGTSSEPISLVIDSSNKPYIALLDNQYYTYNTNYVAVRIGYNGSGTVGSYFAIDVSEYKGQTVTITIWAAGSGSNADLVLSTDAGANNTGIDSDCYITLTTDRTPTELTWTGIIGDDCDTLYVKTYNNRAWILSIDMTTYVSVEVNDVPVVHLDFSEPETYESWIGAAPTTASDSSSGWTELSSVGTSNEPISLVIDSSNKPYIALLDNQYYTYNTNYVAVRIGYNGSGTVGSYFAIDVSEYQGKTVTVTIWAAGSGSNADLVLSANASANNTGIGDGCYISLTTDRTPTELTWTGVIDDSWNTLYIKTYNNRAWIISIDMVVHETSAKLTATNIVRLDFSDSSTYESWIGAAPTTAADSSSGWTELSSVGTSSEPISLVIDSSNKPYIALLDNQYYTYSTNYVAVRIGYNGSGTVGSYFAIDVSEYKGQTVTITIWAAGSGSNADLVLSADANANNTGIDDDCYISLTTDRTPTELTWTGVIDESWDTLYIKTYNNRAWILSIEMDVYM